MRGKVRESAGMLGELGGLIIEGPCSHGKTFRYLLNGWMNEQVSY